MARTDAVAALRAVERVAGTIAPVLLASEIRSVAADDRWHSAAHGRGSVAVHFTWVPDAVAVAPAVEAALEPFAARPHWGTVFTTRPGRVQELWERLTAFAELARTVDPSGKFRNAMLDAYLPA